MEFVFGLFFRLLGLAVFVLICNAFADNNSRVFFKVFEMFKNVLIELISLYSFVLDVTVNKLSLINTSYILCIFNSVHVFFFSFLSRPVQAMPVVMTNSLGQVTLNSSSILTTGVPVTVANASASAPPKLVIQALPTVLPTNSKAGEKITIITIPANQLATLMQANSSGQITQLIQTKPAASTPTVQLTGSRPTPQLILAKPAAIAQPLPQLSVQVGQQHPGPPKTPYQQPKPSNIQPENTQPESLSVAPPLSSLSTPPAKPSSS